MSTLTVQNIQGSASSSNTVNVASGHKISGAAGSIVAPGNIIQVVTGPANAARVSSTSTSYVDSPINATITPKFASSKILARFSCMVLCNPNYYIYLRLVRSIAGGSFSLLDAHANEDDTLLDAYTDTASFMMTGHELIDSPNTTSSIVYKVQYRSADSNNLAYIGRGTSSNNKNSMHITLMEIAQ